jgi:hypothetical protein
MRTLLLASAACFITVGAALAQTTSAAPAPQGATNAPVETPDGGAPGKTTPSTATTAGTSATPAPSNSMSSAAPAPTGATNAPVETSGNAAPGKTTPDNSTAGNNTPTEPTAMNSPATPAPTHKWHHHDENGMAMPADADAGKYLHIAKDAIAHHNKMRADDALSHAETRLLSRAVPQTESNPVDDNPAVKSIEQARAALHSGDMDTAASDTQQAMQEMHHHMGPMASSAIGQ